MDVLELIRAAPNLAFGLVALWYVQQVQKERTAENARYADSLEKINKLYLNLLERAITAIAANATQSTQNGETLAKILGEFGALRTEFGGLREYIKRAIRNSSTGHASNSRRSQ